jgi:hypothetical protein
MLVVIKAFVKKAYNNLVINSSSLLSKEAKKVLII